MKVATAILLVLFATVVSANEQSGKQIYQQYCASCHDVGTDNAPRLADQEAWQQLFERAGGYTPLVSSVINGKGAMPKWGSCPNCNEQDMLNAVRYLLNKEVEQQAQHSQTNLPLHLIKLPKGYRISIYADNVPGARQLAVTENGVVFVGSSGKGKVYALLPNKDFSKAQRTVLVAENLNDPRGVAYHQNDLYVGETNQIRRYPNILKNIKKAESQIIYDDFPNRSWHGTKYIKFGPDGYLYTSVGMPCNVCNYRETQPIFGTIVRMKKDGSAFEIFAKGVRSVVGLDWHPKTKELWFTNNGQDLWGDDIPPDEIYRAATKDLDFGFPYVYGNNLPAPGYEQQETKHFTPPVAELPAHVAPLGMVFRGDELYIAEHGSWNRSSKVGYQVIKAKVSDKKVLTIKPFATGWLQDQTAWGRPVDVAFMLDGSLLISDDQAGVIYKISMGS